jgi:threonylcarbamoyladenosine tRNA methylthiotransferase MtaB
MNIFLDSIGCRLNQSEIEKYASQFIEQGHQLVPRLEEADLVVLNTCAVTAAASADSRQRLHKWLRKPGLRIVATGCLPPQEISALQDLPGDLTWVPNLMKDNLVQLILENAAGSPRSGRSPVPGIRSRTRAFIKAQDGCDNHCTFCVTRLARGVSRSTPAETVLADMKNALAAGAREIVLTGVHLGSWGLDIGQEQNLRDLIARILLLPGDYRLRLSSIEPWGIPAGFFSLWQQDDRLCPHFHLPMQSGSAATLKRMARNNTPESFRQLVQEIRAVLPRASITTDVIVGFPGESDSEFNETVEFIRAMKFSGGHVFHYSERPGTAAVRLPDPVSDQVKKHRGEIIRNLIKESAGEIAKTKIMTAPVVLWEKGRVNSAGQKIHGGLTKENDRVFTRSDQDIQNQFLPVRLLRWDGSAFWGEISAPETPGSH